MYCRRLGIPVKGRDGDEPGVELGSTVEGDQVGRGDESVDGAACRGNSDESGDPPVVVSGCGVAAALDDDALGTIFQTSPALCPCQPHRPLGDMPCYVALVPNSTVDCSRPLIATSIYRGESRL